mmetsp:Transcript_39297/g.73695  ORF Transcript_39297/g.73695 Transcript_39297/m.73695 type:complete len:100 (+) Transcript_39297:9-308(+)
MNKYTHIDMYMLQKAMQWLGTGRRSCKSPLYTLCNIVRQFQTVPFSEKRKNKSAHRTCRKNICIVSVSLLAAKKTFRRETCPSHLPFLNLKPNQAPITW